MDLPGADRRISELKGGEGKLKHVVGHKETIATQSFLVRPRSLGINLATLFKTKGSAATMAPKKRKKTSICENGKCRGMSEDTVSKGKSGRKPESRRKDALTVGGIIRQKEGREIDKGDYVLKRPGSGKSVLLWGFGAEKNVGMYRVLTELVWIEQGDRKINKSQKMW